MSFRQYFEFYDEPPRSFGEHVRRTSDREVCAFVLLGVLAALASVCLLSGCATLSTADKAGVALCQLWQATNPPPSTADNVAQVSCDVIEVTAPWVQAAQLAAAKPNAQAAVDALVAHPPLSIAAPCIDLKNPYQQHEGE